jgi:nicotinate-nucleotide adenylyltransferase
VPRVIGVFGGTFAPIHNGHLRLAIEAREQLRLDEVRMIPAALPPLRKAPGISGERRLRWVRLALRDEPELFADDTELHREGPSYTVDTLAVLRAKHPKVALCLLLGQDQAHRLPRWHRWRELPTLAHLVFFHRPGEAEQFPAPVARLLRGRRARSVAQLRTKTAGLWWRCAMPPLDIAASDIRRRLHRGQSVRGLLPDIVIDDFNRMDLEAFAQDEKPAR